MTWGLGLEKLERGPLAGRKEQGGSFKKKTEEGRNRLKARGPQKAAEKFLGSDAEEGEMVGGKNRRCERGPIYTRSFDSSEGALKRYFWGGRVSPSPFSPVRGLCFSFLL